MGNIIGDSAKKLFGFAQRSSIMMNAAVKMSTAYGTRGALLSNIGHSFIKGAVPGAAIGGLTSAVQGNSFWHGAWHGAVTGGLGYAGYDVGVKGMGSELQSGGKTYKGVGAAWKRYGSAWNKSGAIMKSGNPKWFKS